MTINLDNENNVLSITVQQQSGGINYFNSKTEERGIYIYFCKEKHIKENGYVVRQYMPFEECNFKLLAEANKILNGRNINLYIMYIFYFIIIIVI